MIPALWVSKTGLDAQQTNVSVISNNLANVNTFGFKRGRAVFEDLLYQNIRQPGGQSSQDTELPSGLMLGTGVRIVATQKDFKAGNILQTENPLDMSLNGSGFFQIMMPDGTLGYTRDGAFQVDASGQLVTSNGYLLEPSITIPQDTTSISIGTDGTVSVNQPGNTTPTTIGNITIADFINPAGLLPIGMNLYQETSSSGAPRVVTPGTEGVGSVIQSTLESSNVNVVEELVGLIETQRSYEMNSRAISSVDDMLQFATQNL